METQNGINNNENENVSLDNNSSEVVLKDNASLIWTIEGRISTFEYWKNFAILFGASFCVFVLGCIPVLGLLSLPLFLVLFYISIMLQAKRLHDFGQSAWLLIPVYLFTLGMGATMIGLIPSQAGANKYGKTSSKIKLS